MSLTDEPRSLRNGTPNRGYLAGGRRWSGRDGTYDTRGENSRSAKLTEAQVRDIKSRPRTGPGRQTDAEIAAELGTVSKATVRRIRNGQAWAHVKVDGGGEVAS